MTLERDAAFLAGFIVGTYDLKGEQSPPTFLMPFLDRVLKAPVTPTSATSTATTSSTNENTPVDSEIPASDSAIPELTRKMLEKAQQSAAPTPRDKLPDWEEPGEVVMGDLARNPSLEDDEWNSPSPTTPRKSASDAPTAKQKRGWSPEQRAAAAERMRKVQAAKKGRQQREESPDPGEAHAPLQR